MKHVLNMFELLYHEKDLLSSLFAYRNCEQQGPGDQELYFPDQGCSIRLQEQARKLAAYWFIIPASQMICQQVFTISSKTANHLANTYALEYKFGAMLDKTQKQLQTADKTLTDQQAVAQNHRLFLCHLIHAYLYFMHRPTKKWKG